MQSSEVRKNAVQCSKVKFGRMQCSAVQSSEVRKNAVHCSVVRKNAQTTNLILVRWFCGQKLVFNLGIPLNVFLDARRCPWQGAHK